MTGSGTAQGKTVTIATRRIRRPTLWAAGPIFLGFLLLLSGCGGVVTEAPVDQARLVLVQDGDVHGDLPELTGATVGGRVMVGLYGGMAVDEVRFHLDGAGEPFALVSSTPFVATLEAGTLTEGPHVITAWGRTGSSPWSELARADFSVSNGGDYVALAQKLGAVTVHANRGGATWIDESGNGFDATPVHDPTWSATGGPGENLTGFYRLDGVAQRLEVGDDTRLRVQEHALIWWERDGGAQVQDYATVISKGDNSFHVRAGTATAGASDRIAVLRGAIETGVVAQDVVPGDWRMFMERWTGQAHELWTIDVNGDAVRIGHQERTAQIEHFDVTLAYGAQEHETQGWRRHWRGDLAGVLLFDRSLSVDDMQALHAATRPSAPSPSPDPGEPPASEPPASEPPVSEPPASEPPASEPPASEPPPPTSSGREWFVAPWGSDTSSGSWDHPFSSLRPVVDVVEPGDVVWLRGGVYDGSRQVYYDVSMSGVAGAPITLRSYPGEMAVFDGSRHAWYPRTAGDGHSVNDPMLLQVFGDHLVIEDLTFRNSVGNGLYFIGYHNVVRRVTSHANHGHGVQFQGSHNLLEHVTVFDNNSVANEGNSANGISLVDGNHVRTIKGDWAETRGNVIRYALAYRNSDDGIGVWNSWDTLIEYSVSFENGIGSSGNGEGFKLGGGDRKNIGTVARFNIAFANRVNYNTNTSTGVTLLHNTSWAARDGMGFVLTTYATGADANPAYNNLSFQDDSPRARGDGTDDRYHSGNLGITAPRFLSLDPASPDFLALRSTSPAVNAGMRVGLPYTDSAPDLGALQLGDRIVLTRAADGTWRLHAPTSGVSEDTAIDQSPQ